MVPIMFGIDVSVHNGDIDWTVTKEHIDFAIIRAGYGRNNIDKCAKQNVKGCEDNGIPYGLYWFSYAYTVEMARNEAKYLLDFIKGHTPSFPLYFDFEYDSVNHATKNGVAITNSLLREMATAFCEELENSGYYAGIYANTDYVKRMYGEDIFDRYDLWYAKWECSRPDRNVNLWQATSTGKVAGIKSKVDIDYAYIDFPDLVKSKGLTGHKPSTESDNNVDSKFVCPIGCPHCPHVNK